LPIPDFGMGRLVGDRANRVAAGPWRGSDFLRPRAHTPTLLGRTGVDREKGRWKCERETHVLLLLVHMPDLEPNVDVGEGDRGATEDPVEALEDRLE
jgi:hypothetical protein